MDVSTHHICLFGSWTLGPMLVISAKAYKAAFRLSSFWHKQKRYTVDPFYNVANQKHNLFIGL